MLTYHTANGGTVEATRRGYEVDLNVKAPNGETIATVTMSTDDAYALLDNLEGAL
ncbi:hypothetical protein [Streptomyces sp. SP17KL33]|uniref:hypothetical protein n=1 Tax=Streptomyces sp. SP17KL33 TaxID=3002534 RepID=UPI002E76890C|nr:hypothetical protein [Streptomyces sp. SP17KL33]MEE1835779.1 hypothetical protein [Streptomyces sp. SP17KL33]